MDNFVSMKADATKKRHSRIYKPVPDIERPELYISYELTHKDG